MSKWNNMKRLLVALIAASAVAIVAPATGETQPINVNTASVAELTSISGIGPSKARAIVEHRDANGSFASVEDLQSVRGIGDKLLERLRPQVTVGGVDQPEAQTKAQSE